MSNNYKQSHDSIHRYAIWKIHWGAGAVLIGVF